jgi:hypothetical protein
MTLLSAHPEIAMIFTDFVMPGGMNGNELAEAALAAKPAIKILFTRQATRSLRSPGGGFEPAPGSRSPTRRSTSRREFAMSSAMLSHYRPC